MSLKIKWRVEPEPTGRWRSFHPRAWPCAYHQDGRIAATISCVDEYVPHHARAGRHAELTVFVADYRQRPWKWRPARKKATTLAEAKTLASKILTRRPELWDTTGESE